MDDGLKIRLGTIYYDKIYQLLSDYRNIRRQTFIISIFLMVIPVFSLPIITLVSYVNTGIFIPRNLEYFLFIHAILISGYLAHRTKITLKRKEIFTILLKLDSYGLAINIDEKKKIKIFLNDHQLNLVPYLSFKSFNDPGKIDWNQFDTMLLEEISTTH
ncbi:hypothetical protein [Pseudidiomarina mangrovi]|uniref:hypothetical protein n=1 Tax=Pseudidiomarina mangrovi TaxID=2487133 RepID=UPI000FCADA12|nr:hypothetical protein [Pseudidiomarina mangrovi]